MKPETRLFIMNEDGIAAQKPLLHINRLEFKKTQQ